MSRKTKAERRALKNQWQRTLQPPPHDGESESESGGTGRACRDLFSVPEGRICSQCRTRPAVSAFTTDGLMGAIHGAYDYRCNLCILMAQWINIQEQIARLAKVKAGIDAEVASAHGLHVGMTVKVKHGGRTGVVRNITWSVEAEPDEPARLCVQVAVTSPGEVERFFPGDLEPTP